ncbi:hypothetical protein [Roseateles oligotrophus]|uniref:Uncharacterized protein n=1 Tax=Roseateles oligotrophus TaxID=1769250 RepID=A0ABT2YGK3_9BURK|nr:hypothetical protein [Roseateles oligotrophus]MCV2369165.1 hypothetical protein [Roseateles oligotrophus]
MNTHHIPSLLLSALLISLTAPTLAQAQVQEKVLSRQQVIQETEAHLAMHDWDSINSVWRLKPGMDLPKAPSSREAAIASREQFLQTNRWEENRGAWVAVEGAPRVMSRLGRHQMQLETARFMLTHRFDEASKTWRSI